MSDAIAHATLTYAMTRADVNGTSKSSATRDFSEDLAKE